MEFQKRYQDLEKKALLLRNDLKQRRRGVQLKSVSSAKRKLKLLRRKLNITLDKKERIGNKIDKILKEMEDV